MIDHPNHADVVWKYMDIDKRIRPVQFIDHLSVYANLFIQPIGHVLFWGCYFFFPALFVYFGGDSGNHNIIHRLLCYLISSGFMEHVHGLERRGRTLPSRHNPSDLEDPDPRAWTSTY